MLLRADIAFKLKDFAEKDKIMWLCFAVLFFFWIRNWLNDFWIGH